MSLGSFSRVVEEGKRSGKEAATLPNFKVFIYNGISKTVYSVHIFSYRPELECQFPNFYNKISSSPYLIVENFFVKVEFYSESV